MIFTKFDIEILEDLLISLYNHRLSAIEAVDIKRTNDRIIAVEKVLNYLVREGEYN